MKRKYSRGLIGVLVCWLMMTGTVLAASSGRQSLPARPGRLPAEKTAVVNQVGTANQKESLNAEPDYKQPESWAYQDRLKVKPADVFLVAPAVFRGENGELNLSLDNENIKKKFVGAINMEKGIYTPVCALYAPYYRQASLTAYVSEDKDKALNLAYQDVSRSFKYFLQHRDGSRPLVLAGFSQGADMCVRLLKEYGRTGAVKHHLVAAYVLGYGITEADLKQMPGQKMAKDERDTGVIVSFNSEAPSVGSSMLVPKGTKVFGINPLNWKTSSAVADKRLNLGACFTNYTGQIVREVPHLCGAYLDQNRGTLKVTDITPEQYPPILPLFSSGVYHLYDYQFFYKNLQKNVRTRVHSFLGEAEEAS